MGAWGYLAFDNDTTNDWSGGLDRVDDLSLVETTFDELETVGDDYLEADMASEALGACEVIARLLGNPGYTNTYTEKVDRWVSAHPLKPSPAIINRASVAIDRILGDNSELRDLCEEGEENAEWREAMADLRARVNK